MAMKRLRHSLVYSQDKVVQWIRWLENEGGYYCCLILFVVLKWTVFLLIMHFSKARVYRANRHPEHHNRRRTSTICHSCLKRFWDRNWWNRFI